MEDFIKFKKDNIYPEPIEAHDALMVLAKFFLGEDWYLPDPVTNGQLYVYLVDNIMAKFPRKYKKFCKKQGWDR